jgi:hypothetical protein
MAPIPLADQRSLQSCYGSEEMGGGGERETKDYSGRQ